jgi:hypothetical protein
LRLPSETPGLLAAALHVLPAAPPPPGTPAPRRPARLVLGPVTLEARAEPTEIRPGGRTQVHVQVQLAPGVRLTAPHAPARGSVPFSITLLDADLAAGPPVYPTADLFAGPVEAAMLPVRVPGDAGAGPRPVGLAVRFEVCDERGRCGPPQRVVLEVSLTVRAVAR